MSVPRWATEQIGIGVQRCPLPVLTYELNGWSPAPDVCVRSDEQVRRVQAWKTCRDEHDFDKDN